MRPRFWHNWNLQRKLVLSMALISALLTGAALLIVQIRVHREIDGQTGQQVQNSLAAFQNFQTRSLALQASAAALVAAQPTLEAALSTDDARTVQDTADDVTRMLAPGTMLMVADRSQRVLAEVPERGTPRQSTAGRDRARAAALLAGSLSAGHLQDWWPDGDHLDEVVLHAVYRGDPADGNLAGWLVLGRDVDRDLAVEISRLAGGDVVISFGGQPLVSSLDAARMQELARLPTALAPGLRTVTLGGQTFDADTLPLSAAAGGAAPSLTVLRSFRESQAFLQQLNRLILLVGLAALLIGIGLVYVIARAFTRPLSALVAGAQAMEAGDYTYPLAPTSHDEAGQLTAAFDRMRASLDQSQQRLVRAARMEAVGQLAGGVAHDFNNLITVINGFGELMLRKTEPDDPNHRYLTQIIQAGTRAAAVTRQLLTFSRKDAVEARPVDMNTVVAELHKMLAMLMGEGIELVLQAGSGLPLAQLDPTQLEQIVMNFAANARDAMPKGGRFTISTRQLTIGAVPQTQYPEVPAGAYVELAAADTGTGMDRAVQERIFDPFYTTKDIGKGTGLGLATVYGIVQRSGGYIFVASELGRGTTFRVLFPALAHAASAATESAALPQRASARAATVLLVEDEPGLRAMVREALEAARFTVILAADGTEALALAQRANYRFDLVLTDVVMPKMGGPELVAALRKSRPNLPVLFTSGYTGRWLSEHGIRAEDVAMLAKPFTPAMVVERVEQMLQATAAG